MIIMSTQSTSQTFKVIPRRLNATSISLTEEGASVVENISVSSSVDSYFLNVTGVFNLKEGGRYSFKLFDGAGEVFRGLMICTDQSPGSYSINDGEYTENVSDNTFIII